MKRSESMRKSPEDVVTPDSSTTKRQQCNSSVPFCCQEQPLHLLQYALKHIKLHPKMHLLITLVSRCERSQHERGTCIKQGTLMHRSQRHTASNKAHCCIACSVTLHQTKHTDASLATSHCFTCIITLHQTKHTDASLASSHCIKQSTLMHCRHRHSASPASSHCIKQSTLYFPTPNADASGASMNGGLASDAAGPSEKKQHKHSSLSSFKRHLRPSSSKSKSKSKSSLHNSAGVLCVWGWAMQCALFVAV